MPNRAYLVRTLNPDFDHRVVCYLRPNDPAHLRRAQTLVTSTPHTSPTARCSGFLGSAVAQALTSSNAPDV
jgi:hypothetical protein